MEQTLVLVKGDGVRRRLVGEIISRIEARGLDIADMKLMEVDTDLAEEHYAEHREKPFFGELVEFITATPVVAMKIRGEGAIKAMRTLMGATNPADAAPGTRGSWASSSALGTPHPSESDHVRDVGILRSSPDTSFPRKRESTCRCGNTVVAERLRYAVGIQPDPL